mmetsp:Transcript_24478/g.79059  ORF Transcript_24478/g.79059 Transcript_24478/m.79059 type:complete len:261 (+) Transcript_24478:165-947(+)
MDLMGWYGLGGRTELTGLSFEEGEGGMKERRGRTSHRGESLWHVFFSCFPQSRYLPLSSESSVGRMDQDQRIRGSEDEAQRAPLEEATLPLRRWSMSTAALRARPKAAAMSLATRREVFCLSPPGGGLRKALLKKAASRPVVGWTWRVNLACVAMLWKTCSTISAAMVLSSSIHSSGSSIPGCHSRWGRPLRSTTTETSPASAFPMRAHPARVPRASSRHCPRTMATSSTVWWSSMWTSPRQSTSRPRPMADAIVSRSSS